MALGKALASRLVENKYGQLESVCLRLHQNGDMPKLVHIEPGLHSISPRQPISQHSESMIADTSLQQTTPIRRAGLAWLPRSGQNSAQPVRDRLPNTPKLKGKAWPNHDKLWPDNPTGQTFQPV